MTVFETILVGANVVSTWAAWLAGRRMPHQKDDEGQTEDTDKARCTGYRHGRGAVHKMMNDCTALRLPQCLDGRCSYHCSLMCKCATPEGLR